MIKKLLRKIKKWYANLFSETNDSPELRSLQLQERLRIDKRGKL